MSQSRAAVPNTHRCTPAIPGDEPNQVPEQGNQGPSSPRSRRKALDVPGLHNAGTPETELQETSQRET